MWESQKENSNTNYKTDKELFDIYYNETYGNKIKNMITVETIKIGDVSKYISVEINVELHSELTLDVVAQITLRGEGKLDVDKVLKEEEYEVDIMGYQNIKYMGKMINPVEEWSDLYDAHRDLGINLDMRIQGKVADVLTDEVVAIIVRNT
jgi:hypothetical protein